jgi:hypothetical protein
MEPAGVGASSTSSATSSSSETSFGLEAFRVSLEALGFVPVGTGLPARSSSSEEFVTMGICLALRLVFIAGVRAMSTSSEAVLTFRPGVLSFGGMMDVVQ